MNINNNGSSNYISNTNRPSIIKHKKNYSISQSCYNTQRNSKDGRVNTKNNSNRSNYLYSPKNNNIENKTVVMPEYKIKLEGIKSRVSNLLNVYSLIALRSINVSNSNNNIKEIEGEDISLKNKEDY